MICAARGLRAEDGLLAPPPGLLSPYDAETATVSRERRRVNLAAREVSNVLYAEISLLRKQIREMHEVLAQIVSQVAMLAPAAAAAVAPPGGAKGSMSSTSPASTGGGCCTPSRVSGSVLS